MSLAISGMGWVTPLGVGVAEVWSRLLAGEAAVAQKISSSLSPRSYSACRVPASVTANFGRHPRLRRSSAISHFAVAAGLAALDDAGLRLDADQAERMALVFAISNGGVIYTGRFFDDIVSTGAQAASPMLFPETVFNAPASHLAAIMGINGASYTLVGDGAVSVLALKMAEDLLQNPALDHCLVVAAEEADWLLCDAYRRWRLLRVEGEPEPLQNPPAGMVPSEGAGAVVLSRAGPVTLERIHAGGNFPRQKEARRVLETILADLASDEALDLVVASANGTFIDAAEAAALLAHFPATPVYPCKSALGDGIAAGGLWQVICAAQALRTGKIPPSRKPGSLQAILSAHSVATETSSLQRALVTICGLNQQAGALILAAGGT